MTDLAATLTTKLGPAPVWLWGAAGASTMIVARKVLERRRAAAAADSVAAAASDDTATAQGATAATTSVLGRVPTAGLYVAGNPGGIYTDDSYGPSPASTRPTTNAGWLQAATDRLVGLNYSPSLVADALGAFLSGAPVTVAQEAIYNSAVREVGTPPDGIPQISRAVTTPVTTPTYGEDTAGVKGQLSAADRYLSDAELAAKYGPGSVWAIRARAGAATSSSSSSSSSTKPQP